MIDFKSVACPDLKNPEAPNKYRASITNSKEIGVEKISSMISNSCTLNKTDVLAVLSSLSLIVPEMLSLGHTVNLGNLGSFQLTLSSDTKDKAEDISVDAIKNARIRFRPGVSMKRNLGELNFRKVE
jgi:predicted histone-like DNA-binding protein